jgi:O-antigen ligase
MMSGLSIAQHFDRTRLARIADGLAVAVAVSLPWSTSATSILLVLWLLALLPTLDWADIRDGLTTAAGAIPVILVLLGALGMLWADVTLRERLAGFEGYLKLLTLPLLMMQFRRSERGSYVFIGFLISCVALLIGSYVVYLQPNLSFKAVHDSGVMVKNYIAQSAEFAICTFALLFVCIDAMRMRRLLWTAACLVLAFGFLADIVFIATSRTVLLVIPVLALALGARQAGWRGVVAAAFAVVVLAMLVWTSSDYLRSRISSVPDELASYVSSETRSSGGERLEFWKKSFEFFREAPVIGHGTGSITDLFRRVALGQSGLQAVVASNPHNQTFAVGIQLGLVGIAVLWAMWLSQLLLFRGAGLVVWIGLAVILQHVVGALFNSYLFDFTEGWLYVFGVGVAAGMVRRQAASQPADMTISVAGVSAPSL